MRHSTNHVNRSANHLRPRGFTVVELLAVIGTITVLLGLLMAGLQAARRSGKTTVEMNQLRQLHVASTAYTASNADRYMPGYMADEVQERWRLRYKYEGGGRVSPRLARFYPWRLMSYVDWNYETMLGYSPDPEIIEEVPRNGAANTNTPAGVKVSDQPWFGYNAYYVGGWWEINANNNPSMKFANGSWNQSEGSGQVIPTSGKLVLRTEGRATDPTTLVLFAGSTRRDPGNFREDTEFEPGAAWVTPHKLAETLVWDIFIPARQAAPTAGLASVLLGEGSLFEAPNSGSVLFGQGTGLSLRVFVPEAVPYRRLASRVSLVNVGGNTEAVSIGDLTDQRRWINAAHDGVQSPRDFTHTEN